MALSLFLSVVSGHGNMVLPHNWFDAYGLVGATAHEGCSTRACFWFTNYTFIEGEPTMAVDSPLRTYAKSDPKGFLLHNPWGSPGSAKVFSPCGVYGGNPQGCPVGDKSSAGQECPFGGFGYGPDSLDEYGSSTPREYGGFNDMLTTTWKRGSVQEAHWAIKANHGGGYTYRLCKLPEEGVTGLTEECFQAGNLKFVGDKQWIQWNDNPKNRTEITALRTTEGTTPAGSQWTRDPIPACDAAGGGVFTDLSNSCRISGGYQFKPPTPRAAGFGTYFQGNDAIAYLGFNIVDQIQIPADLTPGKYVLSFRWDCEQTYQVWNTCSNIQITA